MPNSKFIMKSNVVDSFKVKKIKGMFDADFNVVEKKFDVNIPIENKEWNVGLIVGNSGTGKTTIAKKMFPDFLFFDGYKWDEKSIVDNFPEKTSPKEISEILSKVGFSSPPDWLKSFHILSNGQKMRAELARLLVQENKPVIYDEFTSVVDRQVAKFGAAAVGKFVKKQNKKFIAVTCHHDVKEWLEPDWIYDLDNHSFNWVCLRRPKVEVKIRKAKQSEWKMFKNNHYLSADHNTAAHKYIAEINDRPVAWCSVLHFPHPKLKNMKRVHRIVVLPDYQGIGIGKKFLNEIGKMYIQDNFRFSIVTSTPALIHSLIASSDWAMTRKPSRLQKTAKSGVLAGSTSNARITASFEMKKEAAE